MTKRTISISPFVDFIIRENWRAGIQRGWPNATYSGSLQMIVLTLYYEFVCPQPRFPRRDTVTAALKTAARGRKLEMSQKEKQQLSKYIEDMIQARDYQVADVLAQQSDASQ